MSRLVIVGLLAVVLTGQSLAELTCGENEVYVEKHVVSAQDYCPKTEEESKVKASVWSTNEGEEGKEACVCRFNYRRDENGKCIPTRECTPFKCSKPNERFFACPPYCPTDDCSQATPDGKCPPQFGRIGIVLECRPACRCRETYWRQNNICVPYVRCNKVVHSKTITSSPDGSQTASLETTTSDSGDEKDNTHTEETVKKSAAKDSSPDGQKKSDSSDLQTSTLTIKNKNDATDDGKTTSTSQHTKSTHKNTKNSEENSESNDDSKDDTENGESAVNVDDETVSRKKRDVNVDSEQNIAPDVDNDVYYAGSASGEDNGKTEHNIVQSSSPDGKKSSSLEISSTDSGDDKDNTHSQQTIRKSSSRDSSPDGKKKSNSDDEATDSLTIRNKNEVNNDGTTTSTSKHTKQTHKNSKNSEEISDSSDSDDNNKKDESNTNTDEEPNVNEKVENVNDDNEPNVAPTVNNDHVVTSDNGNGKTKHNFVQSTSPDGKESTSLETSSTDSGDENDNTHSEKTVKKSSAKDSSLDGKNKSDSSDLQTSTLTINNKNDATDDGTTTSTSQHSKSTHKNTKNNESIDDSSDDTENGQSDDVSVDDKTVSRKKRAVSVNSEKYIAPYVDNNGGPCQGRNEDYKCVQECPPQKTCKNLNIEYSCLAVVTPCVNKCVCKQGYVRNELEECVTVSQCDLGKTEHSFVQNTSPDGKQSTSLETSSADSGDDKDNIHSQQTIRKSSSRDSSPDGKKKSNSDDEATDSLTIRNKNEVNDDGTTTSTSKHTKSTHKSINDSEEVSDSTDSDNINRKDESNTNIVPYVNEADESDTNVDVESNENDTNDSNTNVDKVPNVNEDVETVNDDSEPNVAPTVNNDHVQETSDNGETKHNFVQRTSPDGKTSTSLETSSTDSGDENDNIHSQESIKKSSSRDESPDGKKKSNSDDEATDSLTVRHKNYDNDDGTTTSTSKHTQSTHKNSQNSEESYDSSDDSNDTAEE